MERNSPNKTSTAPQGSSSLAALYCLLEVQGMRHALRAVESQDSLALSDLAVKPYSIPLSQLQSG